MWPSNVLWRMRVSSATPEGPVDVFVTHLSVSRRARARSGGGIAAIAARIQRAPEAHRDLDAVGRLPLELLGRADGLSLSLH